MSVPDDLSTVPAESWVVYVDPPNQRIIVSVSNPNVSSVQLLINDDVRAEVSSTETPSNYTFTLVPVDAFDPDNSLSIRVRKAN